MMESVQLCTDRKESDKEPKYMQGHLCVYMCCVLLSAGTHYSKNWLDLYILSKYTYRAQ